MKKLILVMLSELYDTVGVKGEIDPDFIRSAVLDNKSWSIPWMYPGIPFSEDDTPELVKEVLDILDMWSFIEGSYEQLSTEGKAFVESEAASLGKDPKFRGFDGNNESEYMSTASFLVNKLDRFEEFKGRYFNSHSRVVDVYKRMLPTFERIRDHGGFPFTESQIVEVLKGSDPSRL
ncbi:YfbU family protein [Aliivibrio salmonicida]|uniref:YfbU family protein n=1 Tax=Aliivibrio salmonicida TaxID=40269 RepID=UPI00406C0BB1